MKKSIIIILLCLFPSAAFATPAITDLSGTMSNAQTLTITGTGFGATGPTIVVFDDFEKGTSGNTITTSSPQVETYSSIGSDYPPKYTNAYVHGGSLSMMNDWNSPMEEPDEYLELSDFGNITSGVYISFWAYIPTGIDIPGTNHADNTNWKVIWIGDKNDDWPWGSDFWNCFVTGSNSDLDGGNPTTEWIYGWGDDRGGATRLEYAWGNASKFLKNRWSRWEYYLGWSTSSSGTIKFWEINSGNARGSERINMTGITAHADDPWNIIHIPGYARKDSNSQTYHDDIYIAVGAAAQARVEIGNNATYSSCTNLAVFTPTSWSDTSITATMRAGSFTSGTAYLFVVDSSGVVSTTGYPVTIGDTYGGNVPGSAKGLMLNASGTKARMNQGNIKMRFD